MRDGAGWCLRSRRYGIPVGAGGRAEDYTKIAMIRLAEA